MTKYSMKPTKLVHAVDDFSIATPSIASNKRKLDTLQNHEVKIADKGDNKGIITKDTDPAPKVAAAEDGTVSKKKKRNLNSRQRRQRALRLAAGAVGPSPLSQVE